MVEQAICQLQGQGQGVQLVEVINAFDVPKVSYDAVGKKMYADAAPRSLFADAQVRGSSKEDRAGPATLRQL